ncbi:MAG: hypothetical protein HGA26_04905, partial [Chlorobiaceae bacterium]|nr:hypothetical protein [Chlorobiaceae bacterium]
RNPAIWPDYGSVIRYRKLSIANTACSILRKTGIRQVIIPAAGFSMLGIELAALFPGIDVFELDLNGMEEKRELAAGLPFAEKSGLHCIRSDISDIGESTCLLCGAGWVKSSPVLLIVEGISYYLPKEAVRKLWNISAPGSPVIMEYLVPPDEVEFGRKYIPEKVFREIMYYCKSEIPITRWSEKELKNETAVSLESCISLHDIEKNLGEEISPLFPQKKDGWIEIALLCRTGN